jgi:CheY-like chemotaxis protein/HPt (histidine-containing phosphotransfer) domain-containing protein
LARILIVDDHPNARKLLACQLESEGHVVIECDNGLAALEAAERELPQLMITDASMPRMSGIQLVAEFRKRERTRHTPIFFHTASGDEHEIQSVAAAYGIARILSKPCPAEEMFAAIAATLGGETTPIFGAISENMKVRIPAYLASCDHDVTSVEAALAASDHLTIQSIGHNLKGTGSCYGFDRITAIGSQMELAAKAGDRVEIAGQLRDLAGYLARVRTSDAPEVATEVETRMEDQTAI